MPTGSVFGGWKPPGEKPEEEHSWFDVGSWFDWDWSAEESPSVGDVFSAPITQEQAAQQVRGAAALNAPEGFVASTLSSIPELFGFDPPREVQRWRDEHPVGDLASQLAGLTIPYGGMFAASVRIPKVAATLEKATEGTLKAFGTTAARSPVVAGALKEMYRYTPLELSRLGTGWAVDADMGGMMADVALSQALAGALGGVGGFLRAGGRALAAEPRLNTPHGLLDTFALRLARDPETSALNLTEGGPSRDDVIFDLQQSALRAVPERGKGADADRYLQGRYLYDVENASPEQIGVLEALFRPNAPSARAATIEEGAWDIRQLHTDKKAWSLPAGAPDTVAKSAGFSGIDELAETVVYPRNVRITTSEAGQRMAGNFGKRLGEMIDSGALKQIADDTWAAQEDGGLWFVMKRLQRGEEPAKVAGKRRPSYQHGPAQVRAGDSFLVGKTDKIGKFAPDADKLSRASLAEWAKYKDAYRQLATLSPFGQEMNLIQRLLDPQDWNAARTLRRSSWLQQVAPKIAGKVKEGMGLADQEYVRQLSEKLYDVVSPKAFKMGKNAVYGRMYSLMEGAMRFADDTLNRVMQGEMRADGSLSGALRNKDVTFVPHDGHRPVREIVQELTDDERQMLVTISNAQFPVKEMKKLVDEGLVSPRVTKAAEELQAINRHVLDKYILPALEEAGRAGEFSWLEGYIMPRLYRGDFFVRVTDEAGKKPKFIAAGATPKEAQQMADAVVAEAATEGKVWKAQQYESRAFKGTAGEVDNLEEVYRMVHEQMGQSAEAQAVVQKALRRLLAERTSAPLPSRQLPSSQKKRTGIPGAPDVQHHSLDDVIGASENHYRQLLRYSAFHSWNWRYGLQAQKWGKKAPTEYTDLMRKATQWLGVEGQLTNTLNRLLQPVLGNVLGGKAATRIAQATNGMMYAWNLGIMNPTFALLNLLTPLQTTAPWISFMQKAPSEELARVMQQQLVMKDGKVVGQAATLSPLKVLGEAVGLARNPTEELREFFSRGVTDGTLAPQLYDNWVGSNARNIHSLRDAWGRGGWEFIKETSTLLATRSEQYSRLVSFNSAYVLGKKFFGLEGDALYRFMRKGTETTMYGYSVMDRSRVLTGPIGSMWGLFKNWQFHFIGQMSQYAGLAMKDGIWGPMLWQGGSALALGGIGATPLVLLADGLAKWASDSPNSFYYLQDNWQGPAGDAVYFGLPALLGMSLQASSTIPGTDVTQDIEALSNAVIWQRGTAAWQAVSGAADLWEGTGQNPLRDANVRDKLMQAFAPRAFFRAYSAMEGDYIRSMATGQPTVRDLPTGAKVLHGMGFNMTEIEKHYIVGEHLYEVQQRKRDAIQDLGEALAQARIAGDSEAMDSIARRAVHSGVDVQSVLRSANTRWRREMLGDHLSRFDKQDQAEAARIIGE